MKNELLNELVMCSVTMMINFEVAIKCESCNELRGCEKFWVRVLRLTGRSGDICYHNESRFTNVKARQKLDGRAMNEHKYRSISGKPSNVSGT